MERVEGSGQCAARYGNGLGARVDVLGVRLGIDVWRRGWPISDFPPK